MNARVGLTAGVMSVFFVLGFSAVFIALGASATAVGHLLLRYRYEANIVGGGVIIAFGLVMLGLMPRTSWFQRDFRFSGESDHAKKGFCSLLPGELIPRPSSDWDLYYCRALLHER